MVNRISQIPLVCSILQKHELDRKGKFANFVKHLTQICIQMSGEGGCKKQRMIQAAVVPISYKNSGAKSAPFAHSIVTWVNPY